MTAIAVVANRKKLSPIVAKDLHAALARVGQGDAAWFDVKRASDATPAAAKALKHGADAVVACGGDGTVRAVAEALVGSGAALCVVPTGTANLFAGAMGLPTEPDAAIDLIVEGRRRTIDTGRCKGMTFTVMGGTGLDAGMIRGAEPQKDRLGTLAYIRAGVREARRADAVVTSVTVDGSTLYEGPATCVLVGNMGQLTGGLMAFPDASPADGVLDVGVLTATGMRQWASLMFSVVRHKQRQSPHASIGQGADIEVVLDRKRRYELDGGAKGRARRLRFRVEPASLVVCAADDGG